jgi:hypothetical protein
MSEFTYPPIDPEPDPAPLSPTIPLNPPMVGDASPFDHVDGENRDLILESIRSWVRHQLRAWTTAWQSYLVYWLALVEAWLNGWATAANAYITEHAVAGYSWRTTATAIAPTGSTNVTITDIDANRPIVVGDLVSDQSLSIVYGIVTAVIDATHATVQALGILRGLAGHGWWTTATAISATGTTVVAIAADAARVPQVDDFVSDESSSLRYGQITAVGSPTSVTVAPLGVLRGLAGFGWWTTETPIAHSGTTAVVLASGPDRAPEVNDLVVDGTDQSAYGEITIVTDSTHVTVAYIGTLQGPPGIADLGAFDFATPSLAAGAAYQGEMVGQPAMVGAFTVSAGSRSWVRVYASQSYMIADEGRDILTPLNISADHGCYLDFVAIPDELSKALTPGVQITDLGSGVWLSVTNTDVADPAAIAVHFDYRIFRE